jgi:hypothetical protein
MIPRRSLLLAPLAAAVAHASPLLHQQVVFVHTECASHAPLINPSFEDGIGPSVAPWHITASSPSIRFEGHSAATHEGERALRFAFPEEAGSVSLEQSVLLRDGAPYRFEAWTRGGGCRVEWSVDGTVVGAQEGVGWRKTSGVVRGGEKAVVMMRAGCSKGAELWVDDVLFEGGCGTS